MTEAAVVVVLTLLVGVLLYAAAHRRRRPWRPVEDGKGREVRVYAFGLADRKSGRVDQVKFGITGRSFDVRGREIADPDGEAQVPWRTHELVLLAYGPGGVQREHAIHRRCAASRYRGSEWFAVDGQVAACVAELENTTIAGESFLRARKGRRWMR